MMDHVPSKKVIPGSGSGSLQVLQSGDEPMFPAIKKPSRPKQTLISSSLQILPPEPFTLPSRPSTSDVETRYSHPTLADDEENEKEEEEEAEHGPEDFEEEEIGHLQTMNETEVSSDLDSSILSCHQDVDDQSPSKQKVDPTLAAALAQVEALDKILFSKTQQEKEVKSRRNTALHLEEANIQDGFDAEPLRPERQDTAPFIGVFSTQPDDESLPSPSTSRKHASSSAGASKTRQNSKPVVTLPKVKSAGKQPQSAKDTSDQQPPTGSKLDEGASQKKEKKTSKKLPADKEKVLAGYPDFVKKNILLAQAGGGVLAMTEDEKKRLIELLGDEEEDEEETQREDSTQRDSELHSHGRELRREGPLETDVAWAENDDNAFKFSDEDQMKLREIDDSLRSISRQSQFRSLSAKTSRLLLQPQGVSSDPSFATSQSHEIERLAQLEIEIARLKESSSETEVLSQDVIDKLLQECRREQALL